MFALLNLPEATKGALFARYSRYPGTLRRLLLDEFAEELEQARPGKEREGSGGGRRTVELYERVLAENPNDAEALFHRADLHFHWGATFGRPWSSAPYHVARTFSLSLGVRF